eukprot:TRINITY_DN2822_c0_g4_i1.p1 TRINITY_DN2822_c0_g4~~TRINITY_DN2822_c0_g4_i1.p1  ORF type:complete len:606 (+),score=187.44 TRINITY_DN2822_c0_g4_i1:66-1883(+)
MQRVAVVYAVAALAAPDRTGECVCDVTAKGCDTNCCCDPDCKEGVEAIQYVRFGFTRCKKEKYGSRRGVMCVNPKPGDMFEPYWINEYKNVEATYNSEEEYYSRQVYTDQDDAEQSQVCIVYDNTKLDDASYDELKLPMTLDELLGVEDNAPGRNVWAFNRDGTPEDKGYGWYRAGDRVVGLRRGIMLPYLPMPTDAGGRCRDDTPVYWMKNVWAGDQQCTRRGSVEEVCGLVNTRDWQDLRVARVPEKILAELTPGALVGEAFAGEVRYVNAATGEPINGIPATEYRDSQCFNAVKRVDMAFRVSYHDWIPPETSRPMFRELALKDLSFKLTVHVADTLDQTPFVQYFQATWTQREDGEANDAIPTPRAGNPGYRRGATLLTHRLGADGSVPTSPFTLPLGSLCRGQFPATGQPVTFLYDVVSSGCMVEMDLAQFRSACGRGGTALLDTFGPEKAVDGDNTTFAVYGNSVPGEEGDWMRVTPHVAPPDGVGLFRPVQRSCVFLVGYDYTFVVRRIGKVYNPQDVIAGVVRRPVYSTFRYTASEHGGAKQRYLLRWRASFVRQGEVGINEDAIEPPPLLPVVSDDIFYPFKVIGQGDAPVPESEL